MTAAEPESESGPLQVRGTVLTVRKVDAYHAITIVAPGIAARFKPGQFVGRPAWKNNAKPTDEEKVSAFDGFFAYCGRYEIDADRSGPSDSKAHV